MKSVKLIIFTLMQLLASDGAVGQHLGCTDALDKYTCYNWLMDGICSDINYRYLAMENCQKTCNLCPVVNWVIADPIEKRLCEDKREYCLKWRDHCQEGKKYYHFMKESCQRTCLFCSDEMCVDKKSKCERYRNVGYCRRENKYHKFMKNNCERSCKLCLPLVTNTNRIIKEAHAQVYSKEFICEFETDECDWSNQIYDDTAEWVVGIHDRGPKTGFNNSGNYMYLEAAYEEYYAYLLLPWELILPDNAKDKGKMCLHFWYQMSDGKITVSQKATPVLSNKTPSAIVKYATETKVRSWTHVKVNVRVSDRYQLLIKGTKGHPESYVAVDHVFFTEGKCY